MKRDIITIDEEKCNGCGLCISGCDEGALQLIDGKARLVNEIFCDGLGACIGECPLGAISIEHREAAPYDEITTIETLLQKSEETVIAHLVHLQSHNALEYYNQGIDYLTDTNRFEILAKLATAIQENIKKKESGCGCGSSHEREFAPLNVVEASVPMSNGFGGGIAHAHSNGHSNGHSHGHGLAFGSIDVMEAPAPKSHGYGGGCPGTAERSFAPPTRVAHAPTNIQGKSELTHWPVQLHLVSPSAPFFKVSELIIMSTCGPIASATVHQDYIAGRPVVVACPKLDRTDPYREKLSEIFTQGGMSKIIIVRMEVPCCGGLTKIVTDARAMSQNQSMIIEEHTLSLQGELIAMKRV